MNTSGSTKTVDAIRKAFEAKYPTAKGWRKPDGDPDQEYYSPPLREQFYAFRDGWLARLSAEPAGWQPIDTAPKDGREILVVSIADEMPDGEGGTIKRGAAIHVVKWNAQGDSWVDEGGDINGPAHHLEVTGSWDCGSGWLQPNEVSHWMPTPSLPETKPAPAGEPSVSPAQCACCGSTDAEHLRRVCDAMPSEPAADAFEKAAKMCEGMIVGGRAWTHDQAVAATVLEEAAKRIRSLGLTKAGSEA